MTNKTLEALKKAEEALSVLRSQYENHGEWYEGWATNALPIVREAIAEIESKSTALTIQLLRKQVGNKTQYKWHGSNNCDYSPIFYDEAEAIDFPFQCGLKQLKDLPEQP